MALGAVTSLDAAAAAGPLFIDRVSVVGDGAYPTNGSTGLQAALRALRKDGRTIVGVRQYKSSTVGYSVRYDVDNEKLVAQLEDQTSGVVAELANATNNSAVTYYLEIFSK